MTIEIPSPWFRNTANEVELRSQSSGVFIDSGAATVLTLMSGVTTRYSFDPSFFNLHGGQQIRMLSVGLPLRMFVSGSGAAATVGQDVECLGQSMTGANSTGGKARLRGGPGTHATLGTGGDAESRPGAGVLGNGLATLLDAAGNVGVSVGDTFAVLRKFLLFAFDDGVNDETLAATKTLDQTDAHFQSLDPDGVARNLDAQASVETNGAFYLIWNKGAENLIFRSSAPAAIVTIPGGNLCLVMWGTAAGAWIPLGPVA